MSRLMLVLTFLALLAGTAGAGEFEEGLALFRQASGSDAPEEARDLFRRAAEAWESLIEAGRVSTRLYTNAGNARAIAGDLGEAVLAYRRALLVDPGNERARHGLEAVRLDLGIEDRGETAGGGLLRSLFFWHDSLTPGTRRTLFAVTWIGGIAALFLLRRRARPRAAAAASLVVAIALFASLVVTDLERRHASDAVLMVRTEGRAGDGDFYSPSHTAPLPAGVEIRILERRRHDGEWVHGELRDGTTTWVPARAVEDVVPERGAR